MQVRGHLPTTAECAPAEVTTRWMGFVRIWQGSGEAFDMVDLFLPDVMFTTEVSIWHAGNVSEHSARWC